VERLRAAVYALSGAAGLFLASALLTSRLVLRGLSLLGIVGYAALLLGIADLAPASGAGIAFLAPGGLFELAFPLLSTVRGLSVRSGARLVPSAWAGRVSRDDPEITHVGAGHGIARSGPQG